MPLLVNDVFPDCLPKNPFPCSLLKNVVFIPCPHTLTHQPFQRLPPTSFANSEARFFLSPQAASGNQDWNALSPSETPPTIPSPSLLEEDRSRH